MEKVSENSGPKSQAERNAEYWTALEKWMDSVKAISTTCQLFSNFTRPMSMGNPSAMPAPFNLPPPPQLLFAYNYPNQVPNMNPPNINVIIPGDFVEYRVPPLWKRFTAETIDFVLLFVLKLLTTLMAVDYLDDQNLKKYLSLLHNEEKVDYNLALQMTTELLLLEFLHKILVCAYEGYMLSQPSGATPGKWLMGLRVVSCTQVIQGGAHDIVRVLPATTLSIGYSVLRAILKNLVIGFLLPICFPLFFYKFNRCGYDHVCRCIVVETSRPIPVRR